MEAPNGHSRQNHITAVMLRMALPAILEQLMLMAVGYVDAAMVGNLGANATAAVSINSSPNWLVMAVFMGIGVGYSVQVAQNVGAQEHEKTCTVIRQAVLATMVLGFGVAGICLLISQQIPVWMGASSDILDDARIYLFIYFCGLPFHAMQTVMASIFRCTGDTRTPLRFGIMTNLLNVGLNCLLIYEKGAVRLPGGISLWGAGMGVAGAALASAIAMCLGGFILLLNVYRRQFPYQIYIRDRYYPDWRIIRKALALGAPVALERVIISTGQVFMTKLVAYLGTVALAANYVAVTAESICYLPASGISFAATTLVGQSVGAGDYRKAQAFGAISGWAGFGLSVLSGAILFLFAPPLASIFSVDTEVVRQASVMLRIVAIAEPMFGLSIVLGGAMRGAGDTRWPFYFSAAGMWGIRMPVSLFLVFIMDIGLAAVWIAMAMDLFFRGGALMIRFKRGTWLKKSQERMQSEAFAK